MKCPAFLTRWHSAMVPKIHARGSSFKGAAAYLLHDKDRATSSDRVSWIETINLATRNPDTAWRVMAATAMDAGRLKEQSKVKASGRRSKEAVLHISLSWSPDQKPDRAEMTTFARRALKALKADDRQAMIICHKDEKHPHVHLLVNRVSPADGRMLSSSNEKIALSKLALAYEKEGGQVLCEEREKNAEGREQGEYIRGEKDVPRPEFEALREAHEAAEGGGLARVATERAKDIAALRQQSLKAFREKLAQLRERLRPHWAGLYARQRQEDKDGQQEKHTLREKVAERLSTDAGRRGVRLPFVRQNMRGAGGRTQTQAQRQQAERVRTAQAKRSYIVELVADLKKNYIEALGKLRAAYTQASQPKPSAGDDGRRDRELTPVQRMAQKLMDKAANQNLAPRIDRERDYER